MGKCHSSTVGLSAGSVQPLLPPPLPSPAVACQHTASVLHGDEGCGGVLHSDWGQREEGERAGRLEGWKMDLVCIVSREEGGWIAAEQALRDTQFPDINAPSLSSLIYPFSPFSLPLPPSLPPFLLPSSLPPPSLPSSSLPPSLPPFIQEQLSQLVRLMGGKVQKDFTKHVTHLIAGQVGSTKYNVSITT